MPVLVDTSVWVEFFREKPLSDVSPLDLLIEERRAVTCLPIKAELLSGEMTPAVRRTISQAFQGLISVDPDWNAADLWEEISELASRSRHKGLKIPGIVDRMILVAARQSQATLWTLDRKLRGLAGLVPVALFESYGTVSRIDANTR